MTTYEPEIWKRLNECEAVKKVFGGWEVGDRFAFGKEIQTVTDESLNQHRRQAVWIPPLYDPIRPERSLIGIAMVKYDVELHVNQGWVCHLLDKQSGAYLYGGYDTARPDLALARAIIEQEGE